MDIWLLPPISGRLIVPLISYPLEFYRASLTRPDPFDSSASRRSIRSMAGATLLGGFATAAACARTLRMRG
jgi:hypothetical protein